MIAVIQHTETTTPGIIEPWLTENNHEFTKVNMFQGETLPHHESIDALVVCGGGVHVDQEDEYPWLRAEKKFIEECMKRRIPVMGLCLGGQLCAQVLGASVYPHPGGWEVGWYDIDILPVDGLVGFENEQTLKFSQFHRYIFEAPLDSQVIALSDWWRVQAFQWNKQVLAFQFHPERTLAGNRRGALDPDRPSEGRVQTCEQMLADGDACQPAAAEWFMRVCEGFLLQPRKS